MLAPEPQEEFSGLSYTVALTENLLTSNNEDIRPRNYQDLQHWFLSIQFPPVEQDYKIEDLHKEVHT